VDLEAEFSLFPYLPDANREIQVDIVANGVALDKWLFNGPVDFTSQKRTLRIPKNIIGEDGAIWLVFQIKNTRSPHQLGLSPDARVLGIGLRSVVFQAPPEDAV
jgi:hypothetical protein